MHAKRIIALLLVFSLLVPAFANAGTYNYRGRVYVSKSYQYVGFTPQKIVIKTNIDWDKSPFGRNAFISGGYYYTDYVTIKLYSWATYPYKHWFVEDQKIYRNTYTKTPTGVRPINIQYHVKVTYYWKWSWSSWWWHRYVEFIITLPKDKSFYQHNSGKTKIYVKLHLGGVEVNLHGSFPYGIFSNFDMTVQGWGSYYTHPTPWDKYKRYWGYSCSAQEYNELMASQNATGGGSEPIEFNLFDVAMISTFVFAVALISWVYVSSKKRR